MEGDQVVELKEDELMLIKAIDSHMENDNCCGQLTAGQWVAKPGEIGRIFQCSHCQAEIIVSRKVTDEETDQS